MLEVTVKTLDSQNHSFSVPDEVSIEIIPNVESRIIKLNSKV